MSGVFSVSLHYFPAATSCSFEELATLDRVNSSVEKQMWQCDRAAAPESSRYSSKKRSTL